jgi:Domain of unknown function (DUF4190)/Septum formation
VTSAPPSGAPPEGGWGTGLERPEQPGGPEAPAGRPPADRPKTSGFAIASLVFGVIGGVLLGVIFGLVALRRIRRRNLRGRGLAIAGLVCSGAWAVLIGVLVVIGLSNDAERDASGVVREAGSVSVFDLRAGDCVNDLEESAAEYTVEATPCADPHDAEVISIIPLREGAYPGEDEVIAAADRDCGRDFEGTAALVPGAEPFYLYPTETSWGDGDRTITCIAAFAQPERRSLGVP